MISSDDNPVSTRGEHILDARNLLCPLPVLKARKRLAELPKGALLKVIATDPASEIDLPHFCTEQGHVLVSQVREDTRFVFVIRRG
jgi:tRNA 2-thiouridine synthesizing protein A